MAQLLYTAVFKPYTSNKVAVLVGTLAILSGIYGFMSTGNFLAIIMTTTIWGFYFLMYLLVLRSINAKGSAEIWSDRVEISNKNSNSRLEASQIESATVSRIRSKSKNIGDVTIRGTGGGIFRVNRIFEPLVFAEHVRTIASGAIKKNEIGNVSATTDDRTVEKLESLKALLDSGVLSDEEFTSAKAKILNQ